MEHAKRYVELDVVTRLTNPLPGAISTARRLAPPRGAEVRAAAVAAAAAAKPPPPHHEVAAAACLGAPIAPHAAAVERHIDLTEAMAAARRSAVASWRSTASAVRGGGRGDDARAPTRADAPIRA